MRFRLAAALALTCAGATAQQDNEGAKIVRAESNWLIDGQNVGVPISWEGGDVRLTPGPGGGSLRIEDVRVSVSPTMPAPIKDWVVASLAAVGPAAMPERDVTLLELGRTGGVRETTVFPKSRIKEIRFPGFDPAQDNFGVVSITFAPGSVQTPAQPPALPPPPPKAPKNSVGCRLAIPGVATEGLNKLSPLTVKAPEGGGRLAASSFVFTVLDKPGDTTWRTWFDSFVVQKKNGPADEKTASIEVYTLQPGNPMVFTLTLSGVGILRRTPIYEGGYVIHEVELYCRGAHLGFPGGTPSKAPAGPSDSILTPRKTPFTAPGEDKGAKDIEGIPRFPESVRTGYASNRSKVQSDETAEYTTAQPVEKVEAFYAEKMKDLGWTSNSRQESGTVADGTYKVEFRWDREKNTARLTIGRPKGGGTSLYWHLLTRVQ